jgi:RNA polymerase sigma factor (sigma-70 family)
MASEQQIMDWNIGHDGERGVVLRTCRTTSMTSEARFAHAKQFSGDERLDSRPTAGHSNARKRTTNMTRPNSNSAAVNAAVLSAACRGETAAWVEIVHRYKPAIQAAVAPFRLGPADSADAVQNTWLRLFEHATSIRDPTKLGGWLATTARRECLAIIRHHRSERPVDPIDIGSTSTESTPEATTIATETAQRVRAATVTLADRPRALIDALYYQPSGSYRDIAHRTGIPIGSIGPTRLRAMRCLRRNLSDLIP